MVSQAGTKHTGSEFWVSDSVSGSWYFWMLVYIYIMQ